MTGDRLIEILQYVQLLKWETG